MGAESLHQGPVDRRAWAVLRAATAWGDRGATSAELCTAALRDLEAALGWRGGRVHLPVGDDAPPIVARAVTARGPVWDERDEVAVPVLGGAGDAVLGVLALETAERAPLDRDVVEALGAAGRLLGRAVERRQREDALRASEARFRSVARSASDAIVTADGAGRVVFWNRAAEEMFGHAEAAVLGVPLTLVIPERYREAHERGVARVAAGGPSRVIGRTVELHGLRRDGTEFPLELSLASWESHGETYFTGILRDITARKEAEANLRALAARLEASRRALDEDLAHAETFQRSLLPAAPAVPGLAFAAAYHPADVVGGDLYDVHVTPGGRVRVLVADVTGHGIQAALRTMVVRTVYERFRDQPLDPGEVLARLNDALADPRTRVGGRLAACCFDVEVPRGDGAPLRGRYANAGQPPLLRVRGGASDELYVPGAFVGMVPGVGFASQAFELVPGDRLYAYTDGLVDQWDPRGERADEREVFRALAAGGDVGAAVDRALAWLAGVRGEAPAPDDVTVVALGYA